MWPMDFMSDMCTSGRRIKILTVLTLSEKFPRKSWPKPLFHPESLQYTLIRLACYKVILSGYARITIRNLPVQSFISGRRSGTLSLSILGRENLPTMRSLRVSTVNFAMSFLMNTVLLTVSIRKKRLLYGEKPTIRNDLTVPCRISLPMNFSKNITGS